MTDAVVCSAPVMRAPDKPGTLALARTVTPAISRAARSRRASLLSTTTTISCGASVWVRTEPTARFNSFIPAVERARADYDGGFGDGGFGHGVSRRFSEGLLLSRSGRRRAVAAWRTFQIGLPSLRISNWSCSSTG